MTRKLDIRSLTRSTWLTASLLFVINATVCLADSKIFFDADETSINKDGLRQKFEGHVVALKEGAMIRADKIELDRNKQIFTATGDVFVVGKSQILHGERLEHHLDSEDFHLTNAELIAGDEARASKIREDLLGITAAQVAFEAKRQEQIHHLQTRKERLRAEYAKHLHTTQSKVFVEQYALILEQEELIRDQDNPAFTSLPAKKRQVYQRRRQRTDVAIDPMTTNEFSNGTYFRLTGDEIVRSDYSRIDANNAYWSPCRCETNESPAWGFSSSHISARPGGYAFMQNPILHIKGVPVLYLPWLMIPLKDRRQSGLLLPTISHQNVNGNMISQPIFFALSPQTDATITPTFIEKRGLRMDVESRVKLKQFSGWNLQVEGLRDQYWLEQRAERSELLRDYTNALDTARSHPRTEGIPFDDTNYYQARADQLNLQRLSSPRWWQRNGLEECLNTEDPDSADACFQQYVQEPLNTEKNSWRGRLKWDSLIRINPRLSFTSNGDIHSDHRYAGDVFVPTDYVNALSGRKVFAFARTNFQTHFDHPDLYMGLGAHYMDNMTSTHNRYHGFQVPARLKLQTRMFHFGDRFLPKPIYYHFGFDTQKIQNIWPDPHGSQLSLGDGSWQRTTLNATIPVVSDQMIRVDQFADAEIRSINSSNGGSGHIRSWRFGWNFNLPLDGVSLTPWQRSEQGNHYIRHTMNWGVQLSARPVAVRTGEYTTREDSNSATLLYYSSDRKEYAANRAIGFIPDEYAMIPHQRVVFHTSHDWQIFRETWQKIGGQANNKNPYETKRQQAERELLYQLDRPLTSLDDLLDRDQNWISHRYRKVEVGHITPLHFHAETSWDRFKELKRTAQVDNNKTLETQAAIASTDEERNTALGQRIPYSELVQPWAPVSSHLSFNWESWNFGSTFTYDIYNRITPRLDMTLSPPHFYQSHVSLGYSVERKVTGHEEQLQNTQTTSKSIHSETRLVPNLHLRFHYTHRVTEGQEKPSYRNAIGASYTSPSQCWGLQLARQKEFDQDERFPNYTLNLVVYFGPHARPIGNMANAFTRELPQYKNQSS